MHDFWVEGKVAGAVGDYKSFNFIYKIKVISWAEDISFQIDILWNFVKLGEISYNL